MPHPCLQQKGKRQRFYARNAVKTTFRPRHHRSTTIDPAPTGFAGECCGMLARVIAYVGALALLSIVGIHLWDELPASVALKPSATGIRRQFARFC